MRCSKPAFDAGTELLRCPRCGARLSAVASGLRCDGGHELAVEDGIPMLFWPNEWADAKDDVTEQVKAFYEQTPFPSYDDFDSVKSLARKAREGGFARMLDEQVPPRVRILECGCGTAQLSNFLASGSREVYATDMCMNSLRLGKTFADRHGIARVRFVQQNLFRPAFKPSSFHLVISNGVLHHTSDPHKAFEAIASLVAPGGYILIGLYHRYGRIASALRRALFRGSGEKLKLPDQELRRADASDARREAWLNDQYRHPHESKHTIGETLGWLQDAGFSFVNSIPSSRLFQPVGHDFQLFEPSEPAGAIERSLAELLQVFSGGRDNGFFIVLGRRPLG